MRCLDDDMVLGLVEGRLAPPVLATVDEHLDTCVSCRDVVTQVARSLASTPTLERGATVGRYVIGELVGEGAMGRVYSAWEPELDRRVALKLLTTTDAGARDRAIREAKAMAKLDHPNVVGVHEVGTAGGATYVAMELVEGETLRQIAQRRASKSSDTSGLSSDTSDTSARVRSASDGAPSVRGPRRMPGRSGDTGPRRRSAGLSSRSSGSLSGSSDSSSLSWRDIAAIFADVARGLAAVHAAGVVHRDVKPDNIVVGRDRRARIADFGLARTGGASSPSSSPSLADGSIDGVAAEARRPLDGTFHGTALAGTPAYMAPEVVDGASATPASDQFSFGVTAYEVLAGSRPFEATTFAQLRAAYTGSAREAAIAPIRDVPSWLDAAIRRCVSIDPSARFSSLLELADVITRGLEPRHRPRLLLGGIAAAAVVASGATYVALRAPSVGPTCTTGESEIAGVWNADTRTTLAAIGEPSLRALDAWTSAWAIERDTTCRASTYESPAMTTARNRCLDRRRDEAAALIAALSNARASAAPAPGATASGATPLGASAYSLVDTLAALPAPADCAAAATDPADPIPADKTRAAIVLDVQRELAALRATLALGDARPILDAASKLVETARASQHAPTLAEAELLHADVLRAASQLDAAVVAVRSAAANAERGHADQLAATIWLARVAIAGDRRDLASADDLIAIASGAIDRAGASPRHVAMLLKHRGLVAYNRGQLDEARALLVEAHTRLVALSSVGSSSVASSSSSVGSSSVASSSSGGSSSVASSSVASSLVASSSVGSSSVASSSGASSSSASPPGASSSVGPSVGDLGATIERIAVESALGSVERAAGNLDASERWHQRAFEADLALRGDLHPDIARDLHNLAGVARLRGDLAVAYERYSRALQIEIATRGDHSIEAGLTHNSLGLVALARADNGHDAPGTTIERPKRAFDPAMLAEARRQFTRAHAIFVAANHGDRAFTEHNLGLVAAAAGDHRSALARFDAAAAIYATTIGPSADAAKRLVDDRAASSRALARTTPTAPPAPSEQAPPITPPAPSEQAPPTTPPAPSKQAPPTTPPATKPADPPKRDVGVYGSTQSW